MTNYKFSKKAVQDLKQIWNYTFDNWSENQADKYYNEILNHCLIVSNNPDVGQEYEQILNGLKGSKINRHIIFYRLIAENEIQVERIMHERMDLKRRLLDV